MAKVDEKKAEKPLSVILLSILTFSVLLPVLYAQVAGNSNGVSFVYPSPDRPMLEIGAFIALIIWVTLSQFFLFVVSIVTGIGILKNQGWSWFLGMGLHVMVFATLFAAALLLVPYESNTRLSSMAISLGALYLLSRKDVRAYLKPTTKT